MGQSDICLKRYLSDEARFADLINGVIGEGEELLTASDLTDLDSQVGYRDFSQQQDRYVAGDKRPSFTYRDLLKKAAFGINFVVIGIEHQEHTNYLMPLRCMGYDVREYERQASVEKAKMRHWKKMKSRETVTREEFLSGVSKDVKLHPCITIVLYFGERWDAAACMHDLLDFTDIPDKLRGLVNNYHMYLVNVRQMNYADRFHTDLKQVFQCIRLSEDQERFYQYVSSEPTMSELSEDAYDVIARYTHFLKEEEISMERREKSGKVNMCKAMEGLMADSRAEGKIEGKIEGKAEIVLEFLKELGDFSTALSHKILAERNETVLHRWARLAARSLSVQEFEANM